MKQIILHIGLEKTGTTYLQDVFYKNRKSLLRSGVLYPGVGLEGGHHYWLAKSFGFKFPGEALDLDKCKGLSERLGKNIDRDDVEKVLISSEHFDFNPTSETCKQLKQYFSGIGAEVKVVIFLRNQIDYAQSLYIEHIKWGGVQGFSDFLYTQKKFNFLKKVKLWKDAGFEVEVIDYDACRYNILEEFIDKTGLGVEVSQLSLPSNNKNVSPSIDFVELVRNVNIMTKPQERRVRYLELYKEFILQRPDAFQSRKWPYPISARPVVEHWQKNNRALANILGLNFSNFLGGPLLPRFSELKEYSEPNLAAFIESSVRPSVDQVELSGTR